MIAKGNLHRNGGKLIDYLFSAEPGERAEFGGVRGFDDYGPDMRAAADRMQHFAEAVTRAEKPWFHVQTRLAPGEQLTREQWERVFDREEKRLGFSGLPRAWSFHVNEKTGEMHAHMAWFRVDAETGTARDPGLFKLRLMEVARASEIELGLRQLDNNRQPLDTARAPERKEMEESRRLGTDVRAIRAAILDCLEHSDNGRAFKAALEDRGLILANGDRRDCFVVLDQAGGQHALNKKLTGQTLAQMRERLADLDRGELPGVEQAQAMQRAAGPEKLPDGREARAEAERAFAAAANRVTEPAAPIFDRDAANRAADEKLIDAAIAKEQAAPAAPEARQPVEPNIGMDARATAAEPAQSAPQPAGRAGEEADLPEMIEGIEAALGAGTRAASRGIDGLAKAVEKVLSGIFSFFGGGEPKLTRQQAHERAQADGNEETLYARAAAEAEQARMTDQDWRIFEQDRQQQQEELERQMGYRERPGDRERERER